MPDLFVPAPTLDFDSAAAGVAVWEKPIDLACAPVTFPDGSEFKLTDLGNAGFFVYRQPTPGGTTEIWDEKNSEWRPDPGTALDSLEPTPFFFEENEPLPWRGIMVAAGLRDKDGNFRIELQRAGSGSFQYFFRAFFASENANGRFSGLSASTPPVRFTNFFGRIRAGLTVSEGVIPDPLTADEMILFVRNFSRTKFLGAVRIKDIGGRGQIEIFNCTDGGTPISRIQMDADGDMQIHCARDLTISCDRNLTITATGTAILPGHPH